MRTRPDPHRADVVGRRLELLRAEIARDWREPGAQPQPDERPAAGGEHPEALGATWWSGHARIAAPAPITPLGPPPPDDAAPDLGAPPAPLIPVPGRHAARRLAPGLVPQQLRGRVALGPWHLVVVVLGVAVALAIACWGLLRGAATSVPSPVVAPVTAAPLVHASAAPSVGADASGPVSGRGASPSASSGSVTVDVEGRVRRPGIAVLPSGSRVIDAIRSAGGAPHRRALGGLNLAALLVDGQQIVVGGARDAAGDGTSVVGPSAAGAAPSGAAVPGALIDLNTATAEQLDTLPGVGPVTAQSILTWRQQNGGFTAVEELLSVSGIGPATLAKITPYVTV